ncbi:NYN domain-containing protein [Alsobacter sp. SYSU M60028]|uniref:NYN domain-containing protein n=1 Tax=Alsobacter ponti TaxID=2962936 RepID=A0ABT1LD96_9HYPH|nr:NYN domain-containing protein [Alsobacter ponti]MCP8939481.1 NYN domain-containing protein [Alsobacter ponti]
MRTIVYVDGFNLYYRLLQKHPHLKWLNPKRLAEEVLNPQNDVRGVRYYTANISGRTDPTAPARQQTYLNALASIPEISVHRGTFLSAQKFAALVHPPEFRPPQQGQLLEPWPSVVKIHKTEEKGSDVNLACHMLLDAFEDKYDVAAVISNDSDLIEPIRIATVKLGRIVGLLTPVANPNPGLRSVSTFVRRLHPAHLASAQFPDRIELPDGSEISRPESWT